MIKSFKNKEALAVYNHIYVKSLPAEVAKIGLRKLILIDNAANLNDLRIPPGNHLEALQGDRAGQYSIRINDQYRICFREENNNFLDVEIVDYH